jgi:hypothetical protein
MNRTELTAHLKQGEDSIDKILEAAQLPSDLQDYNPEQVQVIEAIAHLVSSKQAKNFKEAGGIYRKPLREQQLKDIALRHSIPEDWIPNILQATKLKLETLTDEQLELFREVCQLQNTGLELGMASQAAINNAKDAKAKAKSRTKQELMTQAEPDAVSEVQAESAMTLSKNDISNALSQLDISDHDQASLREYAQALGQKAVGDITIRMADMADSISQEIDAVASQMIIEAIFGNHSPVKPDIDRGLARLDELQAQRRQK